jgi:putative tryptophan/tyrosine transport system substrate-binding protein
VAARRVAQDSHRVRGIAVLMNRAADNPEALGFVRAFAERLAELGWVTGQNVRIDYRWYAGDADAARKYAAELTTSSRISFWLPALSV